LLSILSGEIFKALRVVDAERKKQATRVAETKAL